MSDIPKTYVNTYASNMRMALNQQDSKLASVAMRQPGKGELQQLDNIIGNGTVKKSNNRNDTVNVDPPTHDKIWVPAPGITYDADIVATLDKVKSGIDLQGGYVMKHAGTIRRGYDGIFLGGDDGTTGFYGNMYQGKTGGTAVPFANGNIVPAATGASSATGMNLAKLLEARTILVGGYAAEQDEQWFLGVTSDEVKDLFNQVDLTSSDFEKTYKPRVSADGKRLLGACGFDFIEIELDNPLLPNYDLTRDGSNYQKNPFWTKSGMAMVDWLELTSTIDRLPQNFNNIQILSQFMANASRTDNARCGIILNA
ncbi:hypothetical protein HZY97_16220 [Sphingomonas sp. R-74633]|uniref:phage capsid protein n=1 Tax=Sphingomonas sp. R-74633 TaxID=2751188 RepID=UPI0015D2E6EE|nr:phage capsid protein [Sphingomonas sp. R-74633]NYT42319.1 hypothetical protein [Sphingomonas sp. R-74633]